MRVIAMKLSGKRAVLLCGLLLILDVFVRLTPHAPNATPIAASALLASFLIENGLLAGLVPILSLAVSDYFIGAYDWRIMAIVYLALAFPVIFRQYLRARFSAPRVMVSALTSSVVFFLATNFAVWCFGSWYAPDAKGLLQCYAAAVPFFKNTVLGDLLWSGILFGGYAAFKFVQAARLRTLAHPVTHTAG